ncbi:MAG: hypothetical protein EXR99_07585 [Gemmataceae bacterium]|nr:hypothetical protein [Gemmataceae bacterium]
MLRSLGLIALAMVAVLPGFARQEIPVINGAWEITTMIDAGVVIPLKNVREGIIRGGQIQIEGNVMRYDSPVPGRKRALAFVLYNDQNPRAIDLTSSEKFGSKGIFLLDSDTLLLCLCSHESMERPSLFASTPGNQYTLLNLRKLNPGKPLQTAPVAAPAVVAPRLAPAEASSDEKIRQALAGTWGHQDDERVETFTMKADGSFSSTWTYKKFFPKLFKGEERCSGSWKLNNGVIIAYITTSTDDHLRNQVFSYRVSWYTSTELALIDQKGRIHRDWKLFP